MRPSRSSVPAKLPFRIQSEDRTFAKWASEVVDILQILRDRGHPDLKIPRLRGAGGVDRFRPYVGGEGGTTLYISPGTVCYCRVSYENFVDDEGVANQQSVPKYPVIGETRIDETEPEGLDLTDRASCSVWLITDRSKCPNPTTGEGEGSAELAPERIEIYDKEEKPERREEELHRLLCTMDFDTSDDGKKSIKNLDRRITCDQDVWFLCEQDASSFDDVSSLGSSDVGSSEEVDDSDGSSDSKDCPWAMVASWLRKQTCYTEYRPTYIYWKIAIGLTTLRSKCQSWKAYVTFSSGTPSPYAGQQRQGFVLIQPITAQRQVFSGRFFFPNGVPDCAPAILTVTLVGTPDPDDSSPHECCTSLPAKTKNDSWPAFCGKHCTDSEVPP